MKNQNPDLNLQLINTTFDAKDAFEILIDLLDHKINFHKCKQLSNELRLIEGEQTESRIAALKEEKKKLILFYNNMDKSQKVYVNSLVQLQVMQTEPASDNA
jgi:hypothetical protein